MTGLHSTDHAPVLVFSYGNPSRGDDGLGPAVHLMLEEYLAREDDTTTALQTDFQLQIEHAVDLQGRQAVLFIDAGIATAEPFEFYRLQAKRDDSITSHAMSPAAVLYVYREIHQQEPPPCYLLTIRGYDFELGRPLSAQAEDNLEKSYALVQQLLATPVDEWEGLILVKG